MKSFIFVLGIVFFLLGACTPAPTPTQTAVTAIQTVALMATENPTSTLTRTFTQTFTPSPIGKETFTSAPMSTAISTPTPSPTETLTPTRTRTRIPTVVPTFTQTPIPSFVWSTGFDSLDELQDNYNYDRRGRYDVVIDPTGSGRGMVLEAGAAPDFAYYDLQYFDGVGTTVVRSYPAYYFPAKLGPHRVGVDVYLENDFEPKVGSLFPNGPHLSLLSDFYDTEGFGKKWRVGVTVDLWNLGKDVYAVRLGNIRGEQTISLPNLYFTFNQWHRIEIEVTRDRNVLLYQDGRMVASAFLAADIGIATSGGHAGLYGLGAKGQHHPPYTSGKLYNDNWSITVWPE